MSPTSLVPGASAVESPSTRSGIGAYLPAWTVLPLRERRGWQGDQPGLSHQVPDQRGPARYTATGQDRVHPPVPVPDLALVEDVLDDHAQRGPARCGGRDRPGCPLIEPRDRHRQPGAHQDHRLPGAARQGVLGQRPAGVVLVNIENRVLPTTLVHDTRARQQDSSTARTAEQSTPGSRPSTSGGDDIPRRTRVSCWT